MTAPAVLAGPFRNTEFCLTGPRVVALFSEYDAACELRFRVLLPLIGHNHAVDDAPRLMPANRALSCRSSFPCRALISHTSNIKAGVDISPSYKKFLSPSVFCNQPVRFTMSLFLWPSFEVGVHGVDRSTPRFFARRRHDQCRSGPPASTISPSTLIGSSESSTPDWSS